MLEPLKTSLERKREPESAPDITKKPTFDAHFGFDDRKRKERDAGVSIEEVRATAVPFTNRNYCANYYLKLLDCHHKNKLKIFACSHYAHNYQSCLYRDAKLRVYEYERERRLKAKQVKNLKMAQDGKI